jgi:spore germination protein
MDIELTIKSATTLVNSRLVALFLFYYYLPNLSIYYSNDFPRGFLMTIHVVQEGDTVSSIAQQYQIDVDRLIIENNLEFPNNLAIGQTIVILKPLVTYTVKEGDTLVDIALQQGVSFLQLLQNNPYLANREFIYPGETIVITYDADKYRDVETSGYVYPFISRDVLRKTLPYLTYVTVFNYQITTEGELIDIDDQEVIEITKSYGVVPVMMVSTFSQRGVGSAVVTSTILNDVNLQDKLIDNIVTTAKTKGYLGVNHTLYYVTSQNVSQAESYIKKLSERLKSEGLAFIVTISPSVNIDNNEIYFNNIDFSALSPYVDSILILSYQWGYSLGPPASSTPVNITERTLETIRNLIPEETLSLGFPVIGYDWKLPYVPGDSIANSISPEGAVSLAFEVGATIQFNEVAQAPYFFYTDDNDLHNVWFKDARSVEALSKILIEYDIQRVSIWNIMSFFTQLWLVINNNFNIIKFLKFEI